MLRTLAAASAVALVAAIVAQSGSRSTTSARRPAKVTYESAHGSIAPDFVVGGTGADGLPHYTTRQFSVQERQLLRRAFGVDDPQLLYLSDSTPIAILKVDMQRKRCLSCYVDSDRLGFVSLRRVGESWREFQARLRTTSIEFPPSAYRVDTSLDDLDPEARAAFAGLMQAAKRAGFRLGIVTTYRTPEREALLFHLGIGTHTTTSMHSYGRAVDFSVAGNRDQWIRFRRFVLAQPGGRFRLLGDVDRTWDWGHVEMPASWLGFHSVDDALARARLCTTDSARAASGPADPCVFSPHLTRSPAVE